MLADNTFEQGEIVNADANSSPRTPGFARTSSPCLDTVVQSRAATGNTRHAEVSDPRGWHFTSLLHL